MSTFDAKAARAKRRRKLSQREMPPPWQCADEMRSALINDGWVSPDTYSNFYEPVTSGPAVYLFLLHWRQTYADVLVAYVGMSTCLEQRLATHNILPQIDRPEYWPMRWFKPTEPDALREVESRYIKQFDPPWNIVGRPRGVILP